MDPISAYSEQHLRDLIAQAMAVQGEKADLNHIDVGAISDFDGLFEDSSFNGNISQWDVSQGIYAANMFKNSAFDGDISHWNWQWLQTADGMFSNSVFKGDISLWRLQHLYSCEDMFAGSLFNGDLTRMFSQSAFEQDVGGWAIEPCAKIQGLFEANWDGLAAQSPTPWIVRAFVQEHSLDPGVDWAPALEQYRQLRGTLGLRSVEMKSNLLDIHRRMTNTLDQYPLDNLLEQQP